MFNLTKTLTTKVTVYHDTCCSVGKPRKELQKTHNKILARLGVGGLRFRKHWFGKITNEILVESERR